MVREALPAPAQLARWSVVLADLRPGRVLPPLIAGAIAIVLARSAMLPGIAFWDTAEFQTVAPLLGTAHPTGYPTYVVLGWLMNAILAPFGEPAFRMNLFAGLSVAVAAGLLVVLVRALTGQAAAGVAAGVGLAASPLAWRIGTHAEPHALHLALVGLLLALLVGWERARPAPDNVAGAADGGTADSRSDALRAGADPADPADLDDRRGRRADRWLVAAAVTFGLAAANHSLTLLLAPGVGLYVLAVQPSIMRRPRLIAACALALVGTMALLYLELPIRAGILRAPLVYGRPDTWDGFWYIALGQQFQGAVSSPLADLPRKAGDLAALASQQLGVLAPLLPAALVLTAWRAPRYALLTLVGALLTWLFSASYANADISRYYLGPLLMAWSWLGIGAASAAERLIEVASPASKTAVASRAITLALAGLLLVPTAVALGARHREVDLSADRGAALWLDAALDRIAHNAVVVSWWSYSTPLWYATLVEGRRPDISIIDDRTMLDQNLGSATDVIDRYLGQRPVYVIRVNEHDLDLVRAKFTIVAGSGVAGNVYEVTGRVSRPS